MDATTDTPPFPNPLERAISDELHRLLYHLVAQQWSAGARTGHSLAAEAPREA